MFLVESGPHAELLLGQRLQGWGLLLTFCSTVLTSSVVSAECFGLLKEERDLSRASSHASQKRTALWRRGNQQKPQALPGCWLRGAPGVQGLAVLP